jgi:hypothetical protein
MGRFSALLVSLALAGPSLGAEPQFAAANPALVNVGHGSGGILLSDINSDGHLDLLTKHLLGKSIAVQSGSGDGRFLRDPSHSISFDYQPGNIELGDVNQDGLLDLGVAHRDNEREYISIFRGSKRGFQSASTIAVGASMKTYKPTLRFVDLNEDGNTDVVTSNGRRNTIETLHGDGQGSFSLQTSVTLEPGRNYYSFDVADMDGDRHLDLVVSISGAQPENGPGLVEIHRGDGKGRFARPQGTPLVVQSEPRVAAIADLDGDKRLDVVLIHPERDVVSCLRNEGSSPLQPGFGTPIHVGLPAFSVTAADVNRDQHPDLVVATVRNDATPFESKIVVLLRDKQGFTPAGGSPFPAGPGAYTATVGDVDEDGKLDIAAASFEGDSVTMLLGR